MKTLSQIQAEAEQAIINFAECGDDEKKCHKAHIIAKWIIDNSKESVLFEMDKTIERLKIFLK